MTTPITHELTGTDFAPVTSGEADLWSDRPITIYEVHPGSWMRVPEDHFRPLKAAEIAPKLAVYAARLNFTHIELLSFPEFPIAFNPRELSVLIAHLREHNLGVIVDGLSPEKAPNAIESLHADGWRDGNSIFLAVDGGNFELERDIVRSHELLQYLSRDPLYRKHHQQELLHQGGHNSTGNVVLPLSHDEIAQGRGSLISRMAGDEWQKFANLRLLFACLWARPGGKLVFMGSEFGQWNEWNPDASLDWHLIQEGSRHEGLQRMVGDLNYLYRHESALHDDVDPGGFEWGDCSESELSVIDWLRRSSADEILLAAFNFTPIPRHNHRLGVPCGGLWEEIFNSDARDYGGSGQGNLGGVEASPLGWKRHSHSLAITLPPLGAVFFKAIKGT